MIGQRQGASIVHAGLEPRGATAADRRRQSGVPGSGPKHITGAVHLITIVKKSEADNLNHDYAPRECRLARVARPHVCLMVSQSQ